LIASSMNNAAMRMPTFTRERDTFVRTGVE
jgi:hypothetical protein